jgi:hypothetical protein
MNFEMKVDFFVFIIIKVLCLLFELPQTSTGNSIHAAAVKASLDPSA